MSGNTNYMYCLTCRRPLADLTRLWNDKFSNNSIELNEFKYDEKKIKFIEENNIRECCVNRILTMNEIYKSMSRKI